MWGWGRKVCVCACGAGVVKCGEGGQILRTIFLSHTMNLSSK